MFKSTLSSVIAVDTEQEIIHFYLSDQNGKQQYAAESYRARPFDDEFFKKFQTILKRYREKAPNAQFSKVALVLPDNAFFTDTIPVPSLGKKAMGNALTFAINSVYKNSGELKINTYPVVQNKQFTTYGVVGIRKNLMARLNSICAANQISVQGITFAANTTANAAMALDPKLKNASFLIMDVKEDSTTFSFVIKGKTMGYYALPFGYSILYKTRLAPENLLFEHSAAELLVLNAKERARAKQLTLSTDVMEEDLNDESEATQNTPTVPWDNTDLFDSMSTAVSKKTVRKLPKFMLRPTPESKEEYIQENFRIFVKWALDLIRNNEGIVSLGTPETVYVNLPKEYYFLFEKVNEEANENKVQFLPLIEGRVDDIIAQHLELYGGYYINQFNKVNVF